ncbi:MAG TPA: T9SS type A sorting domain-containing protein, partial [Cryomorphaceae bacterium]|nr:T9SS type A sorting domain-containing protein [Cryomorphaceae bacterium]
NFAEQGLKVYPNPADLFTVIESNGMGEKIQLFDLSGRMLRQQVSTSNQTRIDVTDLSPGAYVLTLGDGEKVTRSTLIIN